jgi:hypothetical protein
VVAEEIVSGEESMIRDNSRSVVDVGPCYLPLREVCCTRVQHSTGLASPTNISYSPIVVVVCGSSLSLFSL